MEWSHSHPTVRLWHGMWARDKWWTWTTKVVKQQSLADKGIRFLSSQPTCRWGAASAPTLTQVTMRTRATWPRVTQILCRCAAKQAQCWGQGCTAWRGQSCWQGGTWTQTNEARVISFPGMFSHGCCHSDNVCPLRALSRRICRKYSVRSQKHKETTGLFRLMNAHNVHSSWRAR